jgi:N-acetylglucosaminyldiphosphoundecaprenol N-acetyl-beta-D-mannosaminyltransferase
MANQDLPTGSTPQRTLRFCGLRFTGLDRQALLTDSGYRSVVTANAQILGLASRSLSYRTRLRGATLTFDGQVPYLLARLRHRGQRFDKISGSDLIYDLIDQAALLGRPVYVLGGERAVNEAAQARIRARADVAVAGAADAFDAQGRCERDAEILAEIARLRPAYVLVALGAPKQEYWMARHGEFLRCQGVRMTIGCGGAVDFLAGRFQRAPLWVQRIGLEGLFRLCQQPSWHRLLRLIDSSRVIGLFAADLLRELLPAETPSRQRAEPDLHKARDASSP